MSGLGVLEVNDANFDQEVLRSELPVLVDFWAVWCGPCKAIAPIVDSVAATYAGKLKVTKVNVDQNGATPSRYGIRGIPALLFFKGPIRWSVMYRRTSSRKRYSAFSPTAALRSLRKGSQGKTRPGHQAGLSLFTLRPGIV
jgi:thioredoxin 1